MKIEDFDLPEIDFFIKIDQNGMHTGFTPKKAIRGDEILACLSAGLWSLMAGIAEKVDMPTVEVWECLEAAITDSIEELDELVEGSEQDEKEIE